MTPLDTRDLLVDMRSRMDDVTDVLPKGELPVIDAAAPSAELVRPNPFRLLVTHILNIDPNLSGHYRHRYPDGEMGGYAGQNPRRNAERKLVKAHGFRQFKKARQVARYILREQAARQP